MDRNWKHVFLSSEDVHDVSSEVPSHHITHEYFLLFSLPLFTCSMRFSIRFYIWRRDIQMWNLLPYLKLDAFEFKKFENVAMVCNTVRSDLFVVHIYIRYCLRVLLKVMYTHFYEVYECWIIVFFYSFLLMSILWTLCFPLAVV